MAASTPPRRRRTPQEARAEILGAARALLGDSPPAPLTVSAVMAGTSLTRKSFYVYFDDLPALVVALVRPLRAEADAAIGAWESADDQVAAGRSALRSAAELYRAHGALLTAVMRPTSADPALAEARQELVAPLVAAADRLLRAGPPLPAEAIVPMAHALAAMNVNVLLDEAPGASDADLDRLVDALARIWERAVGAAG